jgi:aspartate aminotransferase
MDLSKKLQTIKPSATLQITAMAKALKAEGKDVISFGAGEPDFDTPDFIKDAAKAALDMGLTKYTDAAGTVMLRAAVAQRLKKEYGLQYNQDQIVVSNGAKHSLTNVFQAIIDPGDEVIIPSPYWLSYPVMVRMADGVAVFVKATEEAEFKITAKDIEKAITDKTKAIILNSPSNPCGSVYTKEELKAIAKVCKENEVFIVSDEIYDELCYDSKPTSIATLDQDTKDITILVNGVSKSYAMTGWRIGYIACDAKIAKIVKAYQSHTASNPNSMAQHASTIALKSDKKELLEMKAQFDNRRKKLHELINNTDMLSCHLPKGAFYIMVNIKKAFGKSFESKKIETSVDFATMLLQSKLVAVVPGSAFGAEGYVRLSYADSIENITEGVKRIEAFTKELK